MKKQANKKYSIDRGQKTGTCKNSGQKRDKERGMKTLKKGKVLSAQFGKLKAYIRWAVAAPRSRGRSAQRAA